MTKIAESKMLVGLEIGSHKVVAVVGEVLPDGVINVMGAKAQNSKGVQAGGVVDLDAVVEVIQSAIEDAELISNCKISGVTLALSGSHITSLNESGTVVLSGLVTQEDVDNAIHMAHSVRLDDSLEILHIIPQEYKVDQLPATKNPLGLSGVRLQAQVHLITCHKDWLKNLKNAVERCKLNVNQVIFSGLASSFSVLTEDERELGVCLIDIGGGTMDVLVYTDGALRFSKVYPYGGNNVTDHVAQCLTTSRSHAEEVKARFGSAISPTPHFPEKKIDVPGLGGRMPRTFTKGQLSSITALCYHDLLELVAVDLAHFRQELREKGIKQDLIAGIVLTGGGSQIEDIVECARSVFGLQARVGYPLNVSGLTDQVKKPQYATVLGLLQFSYHNGSDDTLPPVGGEILRKIGRAVGGAIGWIKKNF